MLYGYGPQILQGTLMTLALTVLSILCATLAGLAGALGKTSGSKVLRWLLTLYTTAIRAVPDLVLMLLIFYNLQILVNLVTTALGMGIILINAFGAGVVTLAFIYGAYVTETFRGAFEAVSRGEIEAGISTGMSRSQVFRLITFPAMVRFALPGYCNNVLVIIKATALVSILGLTEIISITQQAGRASQHLFFFTILAAVVYLAFTCIVLLALSFVGKRYNAGVKGSLL